MSYNNYFAGKSADVRTIMPAQLQNQLPGLETRASSKRITAPCGFFMRSVRARLSMVGRMGEPKGSPGFFDDRFSSPVRFTTRTLESVVVNPLTIVKGIVP